MDYEWLMTIRNKKTKINKQIELAVNGSDRKEKRPVNAMMLKIGDQ